MSAVWLAGVAVCVRALVRYETTPGAAAEAPARWPSELPFARGAGGYTLVLVGHPKCPCTRATIAELGEVIAGAHEPLHTIVVFVRPHGVAADWANTPLVDTARRMPGVVTVIDQDGCIAGLLRVRTSGEALLYDPAGRLLFAGGLTGARGHVGTNPGLEAVHAVLQSGTGAAWAPVYGCPLTDTGRPRERCTS